MKETTRQEKGITLIALVLTIIVLIVLAAVSVATLTGDNGILTKAQEARETTKKAEIEEQLRLAQLSAKIKKSGGDITIGEYLQELTEEKVDFVEGDTTQYGDLYDIYKKVIVVEGKYIYGLNEKNGDIVFEEKGTEDKIKPTVKSIEIVEKIETTTETRIKVKVTTVRNNGGTLKYYIKEEDAVDYALVEEQEGEEYTFKNLNPNKTYSKIKVEAKAPNGETAYLEIEISNVPSLEKPEAVTLSYRANGQAIGENTWTKEPVTVTVEVNTNIVNTQGYTLQTAKSTGVESTGELDWQGTASQNFTTKGTIYARLIDKTNGSKGKEYKKVIDKIDTTPPTINLEKTKESVTTTTNSITITASASDEESGIGKYYFSKDNGTTWESTEGIEEGQTENSYTFNNLTQNQTYHLKIKVTDNVGNEAISEIITQKTGNVPNSINKETDTVKGNMTFIYTPNTVTNDTVTVTIATDEQGYDIQYNTVDPTVESNWKPYTEGIVFESNGIIYARLKDSTGQVGGYATGNITKIDKIVPNEATIELSTRTAGVGRDITAKVIQSDNTGGSGVDTTKCKWIFSKNSSKIGTNEADYTGGIFTSNPQTLSFSSTVEGTYYLHVLTVDKLGYAKETISASVEIHYLAPSSYSYSFKAGDNITAYVYPINDAGENEILYVGSGSMKDMAGYPDTGEGDGPWQCFANRGDRDIKKCIVSEGITSIGEIAFAGMSKLESVIIPDSVTAIEDLAFVGCSSLRDIYVPESVSTIGSIAFSNCNATIHVKGKSSAPSTWASDWLTGFKGTVEWNCPH